MSNSIYKITELVATPKQEDQYPHSAEGFDPASMKWDCPSHDAHIAWKAIPP